MEQPQLSWSPLRDERREGIGRQTQAEYAGSEGYDKEEIP